MAALHLSATDLYLSCTICQSTLANICAEQKNRSEGLPRDKAAPHRKVPKLWLTGCAHVTCAKHLEGGGKICVCLGTTLTAYTDAMF